jgi:pimeloyl-ACP methyl ester carboxylesterase
MRLLISCLLCTATGVPAEEAPRLEMGAAKLGVPFDRYTTKDALGRTITFYLSVAPAKEPAARRPVVLFIPGSGCQSVFQRLGDRVGGGYHTVLFQEAKGRARILVVEKPGVKYRDAPPPTASLAKAAREEFLKKHTLPRWAEANAAALRAAWALPGVDAARSLVVGHSEGGLVAARVAAELPRVTHVASLAGGGPTQLYDFVASAAWSRPDDKPGDAGRRVQDVYDAWAKIRQDPESITQFWLGHPYRRWSSFLPQSVTEALLRTKARVYAAAGTRDEVIPVAAHDMLVAELRARGRDVAAERLEGADHGFLTEQMPRPPAGMQAVLGRVLQWLLAEETKGKSGAAPGAAADGRRHFGFREFLARSGGRCRALPFGLAFQTPGPSPVRSGHAPDGLQRSLHG